MARSAFHRRFPRRDSERGVTIAPSQTLAVPLVTATANPPWFLRIASELDTADARAVALMRGLTVAQINWKPRPDAWSIGQCLEHLCLSNEVYAPPMLEALGDEATGPADEIRPGWFGRWFIRRYIEPTTQSMRARAPTKIVPVATQIDASILDRFLRSNTRIREVMAGARRHDVNHVRFRNPFVPLIRFTVGTGLQIIARHNHRHLLQAERVEQSPGFSPIRTG